MKHTPALRMRPLPFLIAALCVALAAPLGATPATHTSNPPSAQPRDGQHDFDFLAGRWKIHLRRRAAALSGAAAWTEFDGLGTYRPIWNGRANINEFVADGPDGQIEGLTLRTYNPQTRQWSLYWANSKDGILDVPQVGQFQNGRGEFYAQDTIDGRSQFVRYVWSDITPRSAHFEQAYSADGGKSWEVNWISDMVRVADEPAAAPATGPSLNEHGSGQYDFDPLLGKWHYHLRRRLNPLTGSDQWIDLDGTGECWPLWSHRAQLDTIVLDGASGVLEGLTLRLFNPKSHQWRLYWANAKDGSVVVPQIGQFHDGHGEFYAADFQNDQSILVKFDWTALNSKAPHFEQSFSPDGGRTWEANWITDQTRLTQ